MIDIIPSSGNVFADLGLPDAEEMLVKSNLVMLVNAEIMERSLTHTQAAEILGITRSRVAKLRNGKLLGFSVEELWRFLTYLGKDIDIVVNAGRGQGRVRVVRV